VLLLALCSLHGRSADRAPRSVGAGIAGAVACAIAAHVHVPVPVQKPISTLVEDACLGGNRKLDREEKEAGGKRT
jgi:hypothetical protein